MAPAWLTQPKLPGAVKRKNPFSFIKPDGTTDLLPDEYDEAITLFKHGMDGHSYDDYIAEQNRKLKLRDQYFCALWGEDYRERIGAGEDRKNQQFIRDVNRKTEPDFDMLREKARHNLENKKSILRPNILKQLAGNLMTEFLDNISREPYNSFSIAARKKNAEANYKTNYEIDELNLENKYNWPGYLY